MRGDVRGSWRVALCVGLVLTAVDQGDVLLAGEATTVTWLRIAANLAIPYLVASTGFLAACRVPADHGGDAPPER